MDNIEITQRTLELCRAKVLKDFTDAIDVLQTTADEVMSMLKLNETMNRQDLLNAAAQGGGQTHPAVLRTVERRAKALYDEAIQRTLETLEPVVKRGPGRPPKERVAA